MFFWVLRFLKSNNLQNSYIKRLTTDCEEEKSRVHSEISRLRSDIKRVHALRDKERSKHSSSSQELLKRLNGCISQHDIAIREEISKARRDTTNKNRDYFHNELHAAMKEIRDRFEKDSRAARKTWEDWYHKKITEIKKGSESYSSIQNQAREEILRIRSIVNEFRGKLSDSETIVSLGVWDHLLKRYWIQNQQLIKRIDDLHFQDKENLRLFEIALNEKENLVIKMREECTKLSVELDKLVENQIVCSKFKVLNSQICKFLNNFQNLRNEINHYRKLMENAEHLRTTVQTHVTYNAPPPPLPQSGPRTTSYHAYGSAYNDSLL